VERSLATEPLELGRIAGRQALDAVVLGAILGDPVTERPRINTEVTGDLG
jgi:hypothetical protein